MICWSTHRTQHVIILMAMTYDSGKIKANSEKVHGVWGEVRGKQAQGSENRLPVESLRDCGYCDNMCEMLSNGEAH